MTKAAFVIGWYSGMGGRAGGVGHGWLVRMRCHGRSATWGPCRCLRRSRCGSSLGGLGRGTVRGCSSWSARGGITGSSPWRNSDCCSRWTSWGYLSDVLPQPFCLDFEHRQGRSQHIPDFLAVLPDGSLWLFDVRPGNLIKESDALKFAAAREAAAACGWHYSVVTEWRPHVHSVLDHLSSQRRPLKDPLGLQQQVEGAIGSGPVPFSELAASTSLPVMARAHVTHMLWHRRLATDLGCPLEDRSLVWPGSAPMGRGSEGRTGAPGPGARPPDPVERSGVDRRVG